LKSIDQVLFKSFTANPNEKSGHTNLIIGKGEFSVIKMHRFLQEEINTTLQM